MNIKNPITPPSLLIVEDNYALAVAMAAMAENLGLSTQLAPSLTRARKQLNKHSFSGILLDIGLPDGHGLELIERWQWGKKPEIAVITAHGEIKNAINAKKLGISYFFDKPLDMEDLTLFLKSLSSEKKQTSTKYETIPFVAASQIMRPIFRQISNACASSHPVIISGAIGTGKSHTARLIQHNSPLPHSSLQITSQLTEQEVINTLHQSKNGTLLIESIHLLTPELQEFLLENLNLLDHESPRLIATTDEGGLNTRAKERRFDQNLYLRLQILEIILPSLKQRIEDIPAIASCFLRELNTDIKISSEVLDHFAGYDWTGNLRELRNIISYALIAANNAPSITCKHLPSHISPKKTSRHITENDLRYVLKNWVSQELEEHPNYKTISSKLEKQLLGILLEKFDNKPSRLASHLSINRSTLRKKLKDNG